MLISAEFQFRLDLMQKSLLLITKFATGIVCWNQLSTSRSIFFSVKISEFLLNYLFEFTENVCICFGNNFIGKSHLNRWADKEMPCCDFQTKSWKTFSFIEPLNMGIYFETKMQSSRCAPAVPCTWHLSDDIFGSGCICGWIVIPGILMNGIVWNCFAMDKREVVRWFYRISSIHWKFSGWV